MRPLPATAHWMMNWSSAMRPIITALIIALSIFSTLTAQIAEIN